MGTSEVMASGYVLIPLLGVVAAAVVDVRRQEIPDWIPIGILLWALMAATVGWLPFGWGSLLLGLAVGGTLGAVGFWRQSFGGGDVKLLAALGASIGGSAVWSLLFWMALAGGVLAALAAWRGEKEFAFAPAIAAGLVMCVLRGNL